MNRSQVIRLNCLECSGDSPKEVTLCHIVTCPLWQFRFGYSTNDKRYKERIQAASKNHPEEYQEMSVLRTEYLKNMPNSDEKVQISTVFEEETATR